MSPIVYVTLISTGVISATVLLLIMLANDRNRKVFLWSFGGFLVIIITMLYMVIEFGPKPAEQHINPSQITRTVAGFTF